MKKIVSIILSVMIFTSGISAFASENVAHVSPETELKTAFTIEMGINPGLVIPKSLLQDAPSTLSITKLIETTKVTVGYAVDSTESMKKIEIIADAKIISDLPGLKGFNMTSWYDIDLRDIENPKFIMIYKIDSEEKYFYMDFSKQIDMGFELFPQIFENFGDDAISVEEQFKDFDFSKIDFSKIITKKVGNKQIIAVDEATVKAILRSIILGIGSFNDASTQAFSPFMDAENIGIIGGADGPTSIFLQVGAEEGDLSISEIVKSGIAEKAELRYAEEVNQMFDRLDAVQLFEKKAVVITLVQDAKKEIKSLKIGINIKTDILKLMKAIEDGIDDETAPKEDQYDLAISFYIDYKVVPFEKPIGFPVLTEENSIDETPIDPFEGIDKKANTFMINGEIVELDIFPYSEGGMPMIPVRSIANILGVSNKSIRYADGMIRIKTDGMDASFTIGSDVAIINGEEMILYSPVSAIDGITFASADLIDEMFGCDAEYYEFFDQDYKKTGEFFGISIDVEIVEGL